MDYHDVKDDFIKNIYLSWLKVFSFCPISRKEKNINSKIVLDVLLII